MVYDFLTKRFLRGEGRAEFTEEGETLRQVEHLTFNGLEASRTLLWLVTADTISLSYEDGSPLVEIQGEGDLSRHLCGPDLYQARLSRVADTGFTLAWRVRGPRKDYAMVTRYERPATLP